MCQNVSWGNMGRVYGRASSIYSCERIIKKIPFIYWMTSLSWTGIKVYRKVSQ